MSWQNDGACVGLPVEWWFSTVPSYSSRARWLCSTCPIITPCVSAAIDDGDYGIRGGLTYEERSVLVMRRLPVSHRVAA